MGEFFGFFRSEPGTSSSGWEFGIPRDWNAYGWRPEVQGLLSPSRKGRGPLGQDPVIWALCTVAFCM